MRVAPLRPGATTESSATTAPRAALRVGGVDYVNTTDAALWLGLKGAWVEPQRKLVLAGAGHKLELASNDRDAYLDGLWLHLGNATLFRDDRLYVSRVDLEHTLAPILRPDLVASPLAPAPRVIALDAGHGGGDPGVENKALGLQEKTLTLDTVLRLKKILEADGYRIVLTRKDDNVFSSEKKIDLPMRAQVANRAGADLFVSVHFNSLFPDTKTNGTEIFVYTPQGQRSTESWGFAKDDDARDTPMAVNRYDAWSALLAHRLHRAVLAGLGTNDRGQKTKHLLALQDLDCPAVLVESVFISNDTEGRRAATPAYREKIAEAIADGVRAYAATVAEVRARAPAAKTSAVTQRPRSS
ncbi:MAG TPA: N-acetylmuramoyl-L-alanine amidase [Opitutaceae bacterium]|nr:N-acetylmuramoyl-L-alanine amidase [Opitutaceae bacterium]